MTESALIHVAVGVLTNTADEVLLSFRHPRSHQGGLWEFPGGKVEPGESVEAALRREFKEELDIEPLVFFPLKKIIHHYADKSVLLDIWRITEFRGEPSGLENQPLKWQKISTLDAASFPAANIPIIRSLQLPDKIAITPDVATTAELESVLKIILSKRPGLIQLRQTHLSAEEYLKWFKQAQSYCQNHQARLLFSHELALVPPDFEVGYHANSHRLSKLESRPVESDQVFSASCHTIAELKTAERLQADLVLLSPLFATKSYTEQQLLGWDGFRELASQISLPVYALGGLRAEDIALARSHGAHGIAGISTFLV